jgi:predicted RNase H-like HicB family nuclease
MEIQFTTRIFKEGRIFVAHALELDVSSCGGTKTKALRNLKEAVRLFLEVAEKIGTLEQILEEAGYRQGEKLAPSKVHRRAADDSPASAAYTSQGSSRSRTSDW